VLAAAVAVVGAPLTELLYTRVGKIERDERLLLMELEVIEPVLFLAYDPSAAARLAAFLVQAARVRQSGPRPALADVPRRLAGRTVPCRRRPTLASQRAVSRRTSFRPNVRVEDPGDPRVIASRTRHRSCVAVRRTGTFRDRSVRPHVR
jgi:hypothetical protein